MTERRPTIRHARADELAAVMNVLDGAALSVDAAAVSERIPGEVLVAVDGERVLAACVVEEGGQVPEVGDASGAHVEAVAVRPGRRGQEIGSRLLEAAAARWGALTTEFDGRVRPFYESIGFEIEPLDDGRFRGSLPADGGRGIRSSDGEEGTRPAGGTADGTSADERR